MIDKVMNVDGFEFHQYETCSRLWFCNLENNGIECRIILEHFRDAWTCGSNSFSSDNRFIYGDYKSTKENAVRSFKEKFVEHINNLLSIKEELCLDHDQPDEFWCDNDRDDLCTSCGRVFLNEQLVDGMCDYCSGR